MNKENFDNWLNEYRKPENFIPWLKEKLEYINKAEVSSDRPLEKSNYFSTSEVVFNVSGKNGTIPTFTHDIINANNSANIVLFDTKRDVLVLIQQFRGASCLIEGAPSMLEFPGGAIDKNETPMQAAIREAKEESGSDVINIIPFKEFYPALPGLKQKNFMFIAEIDSSKLPETSGIASEGEFTNLIILPVEHIKELRTLPETNVATTIIALDYLDSYQKNENGDIVKGHEVMKEKLSKKTKLTIEG